MPHAKPDWDIFCAVIDNFGDIGICWRLSRQLVREHQLAVRLWVDDLASFAKICPQIDPQATMQQCEGVTVQLWSEHTEWAPIEVPEVVIEALACTIPLPYQQQMATKPEKPLWLNLEYLSAEDWVESCHALPSPQPHLPLDKYFFFPGFTTATGGLLREDTLLQQAEEFSKNHALQSEFWQWLGIFEHQQYQQKISLFGYDHPQLDSLLQYWQRDSKTTLCIVPQGVLAAQLQQLYPALVAAQQATVGNLTLRIVDFMPQPLYDKLLFACDINFVRGEDSVIRAHWAAKPFIWQIYRQQEAAHIVKLEAFLARYCQAMPQPLAQAVKQFWLAWNSDAELGQSWLQFAAFLPQISDVNQSWQAELVANGDLASNLVHFVEKKFIMRRNFS